MGLQLCKVRSFGRKIRHKSTPPAALCPRGSGHGQIFFSVPFLPCNGSSLLLLEPDSRHALRPGKFYSRMTFPGVSEFMIATPTAERQDFRSMSMPVGKLLVRHAALLMRGLLLLNLLYCAVEIFELCRDSPLLVKQYALSSCQGKRLSLSRGGG